jgi:hypothetical protein
MCMQLMVADVHRVSGRCLCTQLTLSTLTAYKCLNPSCQVICRHTEKKNLEYIFSHYEIFAHSSISFIISCEQRWSAYIYFDADTAGAYFEAVITTFIITTTSL